MVHFLEFTENHNTKEVDKKSRDQRLIVLVNTNQNMRFINGFAIAKDGFYSNLILFYFTSFRRPNSSV